MLNNFIQTYDISKKVCDDLIKTFEKNKKFHREGIVGKGLVNPEVKKSTDFGLIYSEKCSNELQKYVDELTLCLSKYKKTFPEIDLYCDKFGLFNGINIQKYKKGEAFFKWHSENNYPENDRFLVFMTYLNTVKEGGETEWYFQKLKIKPKKGLTVIWPADWMFLHRGCPSKKYEKYIITGWFNKYY